MRTLKTTITAMATMVAITTTSVLANSHVDSYINSLDVAPSDKSYLLMLEKFHNINCVGISDTIYTRITLEGSSCNITITQDKAKSQSCLVVKTK